MPPEVGRRVLLLMDVIELPCFFFVFWISIKIVLAFSMDMPQKSGTKCVHCR